MPFKEGEVVLILDTLYKPAGTARILAYNKNSSFYVVSFRYPGARQDEQFEIPERRILVHSHFTNPEFAA
jgi:hypothetical protein